MKILGIETSCDETAIAVVEDGQKILSEVLATSLPLHAQTGGIIPETAAREQVKVIIPTLDATLDKLETVTGSREFDSIAVTHGPGLIGSLLIGVETAKALAWITKKPLIPVNHLVGHVYANFIDREQPIPLPFLTLIVSGGHTDLVLVEDHGTSRWLGGTRDDAAGEAFDKVARLLGLGFPGGPAIQKATEHNHENKAHYHLPRPMLHSGDSDFSFSGLKTAMRTLVEESQNQPRHSGDDQREDSRIFPDQLVELDKRRSLPADRQGWISRRYPKGCQDDGVVAELAAAFQQAVVDVLITKTLKAAHETNAKAILLSGGVAANALLRKELEEKSQLPVFMPAIRLCTDNGAMIAAAAYYNNFPVDWQEVNANPGLPIEER